MHFEDLFVGFDFDKLGFGSVVLDGGDAFLEDGFGRIGFALADDLAVLRLEDEEDFAIGGGLDFELAVFRGVLADGFDALQSVAFRLVLLAGQNDFAVASFQVKHDLPVCDCLQLKFASHDKLLVVVEVMALFLKHLIKIYKRE